jgi:hypothetical protein
MEGNARREELRPDVRVGEALASELLRQLARRADERSGARVQLGLEQRQARAEPAGFV